MATPIKSKATWVRSLPVEQLACRVRHNWPMDRLRPGKPVPRGILTFPQPDGATLVTETCPECGKKRHSVRGRQGQLLEPYSYTDPENWVRVPAEIRLTRADARDAVIGQMWMQLLGRKAS